MRDWNIYPAIDLLGGRVVRLRQGDPTRLKQYSQDPGQVAQDWQAEGAQWLHVINLDGAFSEKDGENYAALQMILATGARIQFGGGVRNLTMIEQLLNFGVARVILGTAAFLDPDFLPAALETFGTERVVVSVDVKNGRVAVKGWQETLAIDPLDMARDARGLGLEYVIITDTQRDGVGQGINLDLCTQLRTESGLMVIAAGGAKSLEDVSRAREAGLAGVILGRALYEGQINLQEALLC